MPLFALLTNPALFALAVDDDLTSPKFFLILIAVIAFLAAIGSAITPAKCPLWVSPLLISLDVCLILIFGKS